MITLGVRLAYIAYRAYTYSLYVIYPTINITELGEIIEAAVVNLFPNNI